MLELKSSNRQKKCIVCNGGFDLAKYETQLLGCVFSFPQGAVNKV